MRTKLLLFALAALVGAVGFAYPAVAATVGYASYPYPDRCQKTLDHAMTFSQPDTNSRYPAGGGTSVGPALTRWVYVESVYSNGYVKTCVVRIHRGLYSGTSLYALYNHQYRGYWESTGVMNIAKGTWWSPQPPWLGWQGAVGG